MDNATPLKKAKKPGSKFFLIASIVLLFIMVIAGAYYLTIYKPSTTKPKAVSCTPNKIYCHRDDSSVCPSSNPLSGYQCNSSGNSGTCSGYDACARIVYAGQSCSGLSGYNGNSSTPANFVGCCNRQNCWCYPPGGSGTVSCIDNSSGVSCGWNPDGCGSPPQPPQATPTPTLPPPTPTSRPSLCQSATISKTSLAPGESLTIASTSNSSDVKTFRYAFSNQDNPYPPPDNTPKGIYFVANTNYVRDDTSPANPTSDSITVNYADIDKPDLNWNSQKPVNIQVNAYFVNNQGQSFPDGNCVVEFNISALPTPTPVPPTATPVPPTATPVPPTATPVPPTATPTPTTPPGQPTNTPAPTATNMPGPTATPIPVPCGTKSCDNATNPCRSGYNCVQANDGSNYCTSPDFANACKVNPSYDSCCSAPGAPTATPTEIIIAKISTSPAVVKLLQTGMVQSFMYFIPALIMLIGLIL